ncbi:MAG: CopD family protein [Aggregatilineales bacterium]
MKRPFRSILALAAAACVVLSVLPASAHGYIVRAIPENRAVLDRPPTRLQYWFSEALEPAFSVVRLRDQTGTVLAEGGVDANNRTLMTLRVPAGLPDGAYVVELRPAFASDGHVVAESRVFFVGAEVAGVAGSSGYSVNWLEVAWRVPLLASSLLLFGAFVAYAWVMVPAWGSAQHPAGLLPPRVMRRLSAIVWLSLAAAVGANTLALLQQSMVFFNTGLAEVISGGLWSVVRIGSRFGDMWNVRIVLLALIALLHGLGIYLRQRQPGLVRAFWTANVWAAALAVGTFSVTSHAAGSLLWPWAAVFNDWLHLLAVGVWTGGLTALTLTLPMALRPYQGEARRLALLAALRRFSRLATAAVAVVIASGVYSALNWVYTPTDMTETAWGGALLVKLGLVGLLLFLGLAHHIAANPERYARWAGPAGRLGPLELTLRAETALALLTLGAVAVLVASPTPEPIFLNEGPPPPQAAQQVRDLNVRLAVIPGGPGINTYDIALERDGAPVADADVRLQFVFPELDWRGPRQQADPADDGLYAAAGAELDRPGRWLALVDAASADGSPVRAVFELDISPEAAVTQTRPPGLLNLLALAAVIGALIYAALPALRRLVRWLDWSPASVAIAASAFAGLALVLVSAAALMARSQELFEASLNPTPQVINTVLPDAASLARGQALYETACAPGWANSPDLLTLQTRLPRLRDEDLFALTRDGWLRLPPCAGDLSANERWHIVNYLRTLALDA